MFSLPIGGGSGFQDIVGGIDDVDIGMIIEIFIGFGIGCPIRDRAGISQRLVGSAMDDRVQFLLKVFAVFPSGQGSVITAIKGRWVDYFLLRRAGRRFAGRLRARGFRR